MLVLSRRPQQSLLIGHNVVITVLEVNGDTVRIGISAPPEVDIHREEVYRDLQRSNEESAKRTGDAATLTRRLRGGDRPGAKPATGPTPPEAGPTVEGTPSPGASS